MSDEPVTYAFRCLECGRLETSDAAAESPHPHACRVCGAGVSFNPRTGAKTVHEDNWEVLADADPVRLAELGIDPEQVVRHEPWTAGGRANPESGREPEHLSVVAEERATPADRVHQQGEGDPT